MSSTTVRLSDLTPGSYHEQLSALAQKHASVMVDCSGATCLPVALIAAAIALVLLGRKIHFEGLAGPTRQALDVIDAQGGLSSEPSGQSAMHPLERLFSVSIAGDDICLRLPGGLPRVTQLADASSHEWIRGVSFARLIIDLDEIDNLNSLLVAWLLQLSHAAAPVKVLLRNPSAQATTQLRQLRLDHILTVC